MLEDILAKASLKDLFNNKPLKVPNKPLDALKDTKGILSPKLEKAPQRANLGSWEDITKTLEEEVDMSGKLAGLEGASELYEDAIVGLTSVYNTIRDLRPLNQSATLFGVDDREPSRSEQSEYRRRLEVLENPHIVLGLLKSGQLSGLEVETLQQFYPLYYQQIVESVLEKLALNKEPLGRRKNSQLGILLGVPRVTPDALQRLQANYQPAQEGQPSAPQGGQAPQVAEAQLTKQQELEFT